MRGQIDLGTMKKEDQLEIKQRNMLEIASKLSNDIVWLNIRPTLGPIIFVIKCQKGILSDNDISIYQNR